MALSFHRQNYLRKFRRNNDTKPDVVMSEFNSFSTLISNGDGTFQTAVNTFGVSMIAAGRFDSDGLMDGVVTWLDGDWATHVQVYCGDGSGNFYPVSDVAYWGYGAMTDVDLNNDGKLDVATGDGLAFLGNGNGGLEWLNWDQPAPLGIGRAVAAGDFNGDGNADVISTGDDVAVLGGRGDGTFDTPIHHSISGGSVKTADFNADGKLDAIVNNYDAATVSVLLGNGDGTLRFGGAFTTGTSPYSITVGDFNSDGRPDVAVANRDSNSVSVLLNDGNWEVVLPPSPTLSISDATVTEGDAGTLNATFVVKLTAPSAVDVSVRYDTMNITATQIGDYTAASGTLTIPAGQTSRTITVPIKGDRVAESTETFSVNLSNSTSAPIADAQAIGTILDNEPRVSINDVSAVEGNNKTPTSFTFTIALSNAYDQAVIVTYATANGTATAGSDYQAKSGKLTFAAGETTKTITVAVLGDKQREANETFFVNLSAAPSVGINDGQGLGTILNDDSAGQKSNRHLFALAIDAAIDEWMFPSRKKRYW